MPDATHEGTEAMEEDIIKGREYHLAFRTKSDGTPFAHVSRVPLEARAREQYV